MKIGINDQKRRSTTFMSNFMHVGILVLEKIISLQRFVASLDDMLFDAMTSRKIFSYYGHGLSVCQISRLYLWQSQRNNIPPTLNCSCIYVWKAFTGPRPTLLPSYNFLYARIWGQSDVIDKASIKPEQTAYIYLKYDLHMSKVWLNLTFNWKLVWMVFCLWRHNG